MAVDDVNTVSLLHFNGADAGTTFTDESGKGWTPAGDAQLDAAQKVFGTAAGLFDGTGDFMSSPYTADFDFGTGEYTIDLWVRFPTWTNGRIHQLVYLGDHTTNLAIQVGMDSYGDNVYVTQMGTSFYWHLNLSTYEKFTVDAWYHIAVVRDASNIVRCFVNGTSRGTPAEHAQNILLSGFNRVGIYYDETLYPLYGWIDELRISNVARWTGNFIPPTEEYQGAEPAADVAGWNPSDAGSNITINLATFLTATHA